MAQENGAEEGLKEEVTSESEGEATGEVEGQATGESGGQAEGDAGGSAVAEVEEELVIQIGEESLTSKEEQAPEWVKQLRKDQVELRRRNRELEEQIAAATKAKETQALGKKPTIDDFDYDADKFEAALVNWHEQKRKLDAEVEARAKVEREQEAQWQERLKSLETGRSTLKEKLSDLDEAVATVEGTLSVTQRGIIVQGCDNPALVEYAIGKSPERAKKLASITDPVKFAFAIAQLEKDLKVTSKSKTLPPPEDMPRGSGPVAAGSDKQLERLRAEAEKTGDYTKVIAFKRQMKKAS